MRVVLQRVRGAECVVDGAVTGAIGPGLLVFVGVEAGDAAEDGTWLAGKVAALRVFEDADGRMNRSLLDDPALGLLAIPQFTLLADARKGTRPSWHRAAAPEPARAAFAAWVAEAARVLGRPVPTGVFGAHMDIAAANDGPVTIVLDSRRRDF